MDYTVFLLVIGSYLVGAFPFGVWIAKAFGINLLNAGTKEPSFLWRELITRCLLQLQGKRLQDKRHLIFTTHIIGEDDASIMRSFRTRTYLGYLIPKAAILWLVTRIPRWACFMGISQGLRTTGGIEIAAWVYGVPRQTPELANPRNSQYNAAGEDVLNGVTFMLEKVMKYAPEEEIVISLGAATGIANKRGKTLVSALRAKGYAKVHVTNGNTYTAYVVVTTLIKAFYDFGGNFVTAPIAVIGAAGSVGVQCCEFLLYRGVRNLILVGREGSESDLEKLAQKWRQLHPEVQIRVMKRIEAIQEADTIISTTSEATAVTLDPLLFRGGQIIIDVGEPGNFSLRLVGYLPNNLFIKGGLVEVPQEYGLLCWGFGRSVGLSGNIVYACGAEGLIHSTRTTRMWDGSTGDLDYVGADAKLELMLDIAKCGEEQGFKPAPYHGLDKKPYASEKLEAFRQARAAYLS